MCVFRRENQRLQNDLKLKRNHLHQNGHSHNSSSGAPALEKLEDKDEVKEMTPDVLLLVLKI